MKKNQQSIDGFVPRRRATASSQITNQQSTKKPTSNLSRREKVSRNLEKLDKTRNTAEDINKTLSHLDIEDQKNGVSKPTQRSRKETKLQKKFEKFNNKRSKKGKKQLTLQQFKKRLIVCRIIFFAIAILLAWGGYQAYRFIAPLMKLSKGGDIFGVLQKEKLKQDSNGRTNILVFGTSPKGWDGEDLTDSVMMVSFDQTKKKAYTISLPRDLWVKHSCKKWLGTTAGKLNESYGCGKYSDGLNIANEAIAEENGQQELAQTATEITGLDVHYKVHGNWQVLIQIIDALGGIDVAIQVWDGSPYMYDVATKVRYKNGETAHMNGEQALAFSRARGSEGGYGLSGGNFDRERNQQKIIQATLAKINASKYDISKLLNIVNAVGDNVKTTFSTKEYQTLAELAIGMRSENIKSLPLISDTDKQANLMTTGQVSGRSAVLPTAGVFEYSDIQAYIAKNTLANEISEENAKIVILNGTNISGLAAEQQGKLKKQGFNIVNIDSAPTKKYNTTKIHTVNKDKSVTIKKLEQKFNVKSSELPDELAKYGKGVDIVIVLGEDTE
ncbi:MAG: LCP family protein [bacterium]|nr:LCP family protein [bacterium]